jgi:hypothetical protein
MNGWSRYRVGLVGLTLAAGAALPLAAQVKPAGEPDEAPDAGYAMTGEIREVEPGKLTVCPWQARLPARVAVLMSPRTRLVRQKKGNLADLKVGELVLVVEEPPTETERQQRRAAPKERKGKKRAKVLDRAARARAVLRCGNPNGEVDLEEKRSARALLEGALPFFKGEIRGGVKRPSEATPLIVGTVTALEPLTVRTPRFEAKYTVSDETLVIEHEAEDASELKRGQTVLVHCDAVPKDGKRVEASVVAVSPRPRLKSDQQRKLILRERKLSMD